MAFKHFVLLPFLVLTCLPKWTLAQPGVRHHTENRRAIKAFQKAMSLSNSAMAPEANKADLKAKVEIEILRALELDPDFAEAERVLAALRFEEGQFEEARDHHAHVLKRYGAVWIRDHLAWARASRHALDPSSMRKAMEAMVLIPGVLDGPDTALMGQIREDAAFMERALADGQPVDIATLPYPVCTEANEYFPSVWLAGEALAFTRRVPHPRLRMGQEDLFVTFRELNGWSEPQPLNGLNTMDNEGAASLSGDGMSVCLTICRDASRPTGYGQSGTEGRDHQGSCDLYESHRKSNGDWSSPVNMGAVNTAGWESQPCLSPDGRQLFFTRGRGKSGRRQYDLYSSSKREDGTWTPGRKMGSQVNSKGKEMRPFIHPDGLHFYFASDGRTGMGGMDLFVCTLDGEGVPSEPVNLGWPINTPRDESGLVVASNGTTAFFGRDSNGQMDLFTLELPRASSAEPTGAMEGDLRAEGGVALPGGRVRLLDPETGEAFSEGVVSMGGRYHVPVPLNRAFVLNADAPGHLLLSERIEQGDVIGRQNRDLVLQPLREGAEVVLRNVFFESGSAELGPGSQTELSRVGAWLHSHPSVAIEVGGHTDNIGSDSSNLILSEARAESVRMALLQQGANPEQLTAVGYGRTQPSSDGNTEEARQQNRRTTLRVMSVD